MTKKELEIKLSNLANQVDCLKMELEAYKIIEYLSVDHARKRDNLVRKNFYGRITDPRIKDDFKKEIEEKINGDFKSITIRITNFDFYDKDDNGNKKKCILNVFCDILQKYEYKQIILDTYPIKKDK